MADTKISALAAAATAISTDELPIARSGSNFKLTVNKVFTYVGQNAIPVPMLQDPAKANNTQFTSLSVDGRVLLGGTGTSGANGNTILGGSTIAGNVALTGVTNPSSGVLYTKLQTPLTTTLVNTITATQTTGITLSDGTRFPASGSVVIDNETISYTALTSGTGTQYDLAGTVTRGASSSAAAAHTASAVIASTAVASASLSSTLAQGATTVPVNSTASFPSSGVVLVGNEQIAYSGLVANTSLLSCTRGYNGTIDVTHTSGSVTLAPIVASDNSYTYNPSTGRLGVPYIQATGVTASGSVTAGSVTSPSLARASSSGTDVTGGDLVIQAGNGTGTGGSGSLKLQVAPAGSTGSSADTYVDAISISNDGVVTGSAGNLMLKAMTAVTMSGTSQLWTGIPQWAKKVTVAFSGVSCASSSGILVQIGAGSIITTGYISAGSRIASTVATNTSTSGFFINQTGATGSEVSSGAITLLNVTGNTWVCSHSLGSSSGGVTYVGGGTLALGGALARVQVAVVNSGTDSFDAGSVTVIYE